MPPAADIAPFPEPMLTAGSVLDSRGSAPAWYGTCDAARPSPPVRMESSSRPPALSAAGQVRFRELIDAHFGLVWRFLRGLGVPPASVDDAAQQVFWVAAQRLEAITAGSERSFLLSTARGVAANARRGVARSRELLDEDALHGQTDAAPDPEEALSAKEARKLLDRFLEGLPEDVRTVFVLFELEGMTMASIAEALDLPPGTVASRLRRGREDFQAAAKRFQAQRGGRS